MVDNSLPPKAPKEGAIAHYLRSFFTIVRNQISQHKHLLHMKYKRIKRAKKRTERVKLRFERNFLKRLIANPVTSVDGKWTRKERRGIQDLVLNILPNLAYRLRNEKIHLLSVILLYDHYRVVLNTIRQIRGLVGIPVNSYLDHKINRFYGSGDGDMIGTLSLLI